MHFLQSKVDIGLEFGSIRERPGNAAALVVGGGGGIVTPKWRRLGRW